MPASASLSIAGLVDQLGGTELPDPVVLAPKLADALGVPSVLEGAREHRVGPAPTTNELAAHRRAERRPGTYGGTPPADHWPDAAGCRTRLPICPPDASPTPPSPHHQLVARCEWPLPIDPAAAIRQVEALRAGAPFYLKKT